MDLVSAGNEGSATGRATCAALVVAAGTGLSLLFACATPFAALATLAALKTDRRDMAVIVGLAWLVNQVVGYAFLGYPVTWDSLAWGGAIGIAALLSMAAALALTPRRPRRLSFSLSFMGAFATYEFALYVASFALPSADGAFAFAIVKSLFLTNLYALVALVILHRIAMALVSFVIGTPKGGHPVSARA